jgi:Secretion system C-terminal sorting domain
MKQRITLLVLLFISGFGFAQTKMGKSNKTAATITFNVANGSWNVAGNWSPVQVPTSADNIIIPAGKTCFLNSPTAGTANFLNINSGGTLNVEAGASLTALSISNDGTMTLKSDATSSASVIAQGANNFTYQRYLKGGQWHLISSPVSGSQNISSFIASFGGAMTQSGVNYSLATYDNTGVIDVSTWVHYTTDGSNPAPASSFVDVKGYEILMNADGTVDFTGNLVFWYFTTLTVGNTAWNLVGNPFPSFFPANTGAAVNNFLNDNTAALDPSFVAMYVWNPTNNSYDLVNQTSGDFSLAPGQGFFVKAKTDGSQIVFNHITQNTGNAFQKAATTPIPTVMLSVDNNSGTVSSTEIKYMSGTTLGLDPGYDAGRFGAVGTGFNVYTHLVQDNGVAFALQVVPDTGYDTTVIPIGLDASTGTQITFKATATDLPTGKKVFLEDKLLNTVTEINNTDKFYTVTLSSDLSGIGRFYLHTQDSASTLAVEDFNTSQYTLIASPKSNNLKLYGAVTQKGSIVIYDSLGRAIYTTSLQRGSEQDIAVPNMATGVYFVKATIDGKPLSKKIVWY